ncbi:PadR family transcriptional regulator [Nocardia thailandica]|uniref:PadR family transcriptional regulator n=1 Tax=Nocardia thailandica TaxID=257275 RepID=UPI001FE14474|nr:PadR family transcriptional regulator [Nocardia thailandica]
MKPLAIAVLALLDERPMHPYEMYQVLVSRREDLLVKVRPGSLYHAVDRLAEAELAVADGTDRAGNRPERTTYRITDAGRKALRARIADILREPVQEFPIFRVGLAEAHSLPQAEVVALLSERAEHMAGEVADFAAMREWARRREVPRRYWFVLEYVHHMATAELDWLRAFIAEVEAGGIAWEQFDPETGVRIDTGDHEHDLAWTDHADPSAAPVPRWARAVHHDPRRSFRYS